PIKQMPIPHASRANLLLNPGFAFNYFVVPYGTILLAFPFVFIRGASQRRLRPLLLGFWITMIFGLGGTTPLPRLLLGRAFEILTFERFNFWANLLALPIVAVLAVELIDRHGRKAMVGLASLAVLTMAMAVAWPVYHPIHDSPFGINEVVNFLNRDGHDKFRYL